LFLQDRSWLDYLSGVTLFGMPGGID